MHLLVDGFNIIHAWPELRADLQHGWEVPVERLLARVRLIHDAEGIQTTVVLDGRGEEATVEHPGGQATFAVVFSPGGISADAIVEQLVARSPVPGDVCVASRDNMVRETISAFGAMPLTPDDLADWVKRAEARQSADLLRRQQRQASDFNNNPFLDL